MSALYLYIYINIDIYIYIYREREREREIHVFVHSFTGKLMANITKDQVIEYIANMSVLEMSDLVKEKGIDATLILKLKDSNQASHGAAVVTRKCWESR